MTEDNDSSSIKRISLDAMLKIVLIVGIVAAILYFIAVPVYEKYVTNPEKLRVCLSTADKGYHVIFPSTPDFSGITEQTRACHEKFDN